MRKYSFLDNTLINLNDALQNMFVTPVANRDNPADNIAETDLTETQRKHIIGLMRINHAGEIAAQGLYHGQAMTAQLHEVRDKMQYAAQEEKDHLAWCYDRLQELDGQPSLLNPFWYLGSVSLGAIAGLVGDQWSLGFIAETEKQVVAHLQEHLDNIPEHDQKTKAILEQMQIDELHHREDALHAGGVSLPEPIQQGMQTVSKVMTSIAYHV